MTLALTINIILGTLTFAAVLGGIAWGIATQHRNHIRTAFVTARPHRQALAQERRQDSRSRTREAYAV